MTDFDDLVAHLDRTATVAIVTTRPSGEQVATPIWAVVADGIPYVRSAYGEKPAWHRRARSGRAVAFSLADGKLAERDAVAALNDPRIEVRVRHLPADDPQQDAVDAAFLAKYGSTPYAGTMTSPTARALTLRFDPL